MDITQRIIKINNHLTEKNNRKSFRLLERVFNEIKKSVFPNISVVIELSFCQWVEDGNAILLLIKVIIVSSVNFHQNRVISLVSFFDINKNLSITNFSIFLTTQRCDSTLRTVLLFDLLQNWSGLVILGLIRIVECKLSCMNINVDVDFFIFVDGLQIEIKTLGERFT